MPDRSLSAVGEAFLRDVFTEGMSYSAKSMAIPAEMAISARFDIVLKNAQYTSQYYLALLPKAPWTFKIAAFKAGCPDSSRLLASRPVA
jgi:hypothetical protein